MSKHERGYRGATDNWITPPYVIDALGGHEAFDLDPCACNPQPVPTAREMWALPEHDGLSEAWNGLVWCNPPYGPELRKWLARMAAHDNGIALIFARTETKAFFESVWPHASALFFLKGRLKFWTPEGVESGQTAGAPSVLVGWGRAASRRLSTAKLDGIYIPL